MLEDLRCEVSSYLEDISRGSGDLDALEAAAQSAAEASHRGSEPGHEVEVR